MKITMTKRFQIGVCLLGLGLIAACDSSEPPKPTVASGPVPAEFPVVCFNAVGRRPFEGLIPVVVRFIDFMH